MERPDVHSAPLRSGSKLGRYTIIESIGAGGMGSAWEAEDTRLKPAEEGV